MKTWSILAYILCEAEKLVQSLANGFKSLHMFIRPRECKSRAIRRPCLEGLFRWAIPCADLSNRCSKVTLESRWIQHGYAEYSQVLPGGCLLPGVLEGDSQSNPLSNPQLNLLLNPQSLPCLPCPRVEKLWPPSWKARCKLAKAKLVAHLLSGLISRHGALGCLVPGQVSC